jgi:hypothetical protein
MICKLMKKAENHENNPRRSWALNHREIPDKAAFDLHLFWPQSKTVTQAKG